MLMDVVIVYVFYQLLLYWCGWNVSKLETLKVLGAKINSLVTDENISWIQFDSMWITFKYVQILHELDWYFQERRLMDNTYTTKNNSILINHWNSVIIMTKLNVKPNRISTK